MKVLVTGGTGFVGAHTVAAILRAGHDVRLLARRREQVVTSLDPLGVRVDDVVVGDVLDSEAVTRALDGCDAVVHAAAIYKLRASAAAEMTKTNLRAAELVLGTAAKLGLDPIIHVSSTVALSRYGGSGPDLPLGDIEWPYTKSKIESEKLARSLQDRGAPITIIYPGAVYGPHDPYRGEQSERLRWVARGTMTMMPRGGFHSVDVRDVAAVIAAALEPGKGGRRYVVPGHHADAKMLFRAVSESTGKRLPVLTPPAGVVRAAASAIGVLQRKMPEKWHYPADREGAEVALRDTRMDDGPARRELGIQPIAFEDSIRDTMKWLVDSGRLKPRWAPALSR